MPERAAAVIKPVVAVSSFENRSGFDGEWRLGTGMADLLVTELFDAGSFEVVERQHFDSIVGEIARQRDRLFRPEGKVAEGNLKSARYLVRGVVNDFSQVGGGSFAIAARRFFFFGRGHVARVSLSLTLVDIETGMIVASVQSYGQARAREAGIGAQYQGVSFGGDAFYRTPLGTATRTAIRRGVRALVAHVPRRYWSPMIADVSDGRIIVNGGADAGYREGQVFIVRDDAAGVTDPATGDVIAYLPGKEVGRLRITKVFRTVAFAEAVSGRGFRRGQCLEPQGGEPRAAGEDSP